MKIKKLFKKNYISSVGWGGGLIATTFFKQILLVPVFLIYMGKDVFAFWIVINSILLVIRSLSLGQLNFTSNIINIDFHKKKEKIWYNIINKSFVANIHFMIIQLLIGLLLCPKQILSIITQFDISFINEVDGSLVLILLVFSKIPNQFVVLFLSRLYEPFGQIKKTLKIQFINEIIDVVITILLAVIYKDLLIITIGIFLSTNLLNLFYYLKLTNKFNILLNQNLLKTVYFTFYFKKSLKLSFSFFIEKIYENGLNAFVSFAYMPGTVPLFSTSRVISNSALRFSNVISEPIMPDIQKDFANNNQKNIIRKFILYWKVTCSVSILLVVILIPFLEQLFKVWTKEKLEFNLLLFLSIFSAMLLQNFSIILNQYLRRTNNSKILLNYNLIKVLLVLLLLYIFGKYIFLWGLGVSLFIGELVGLLYIFFTYKNSLFTLNKLKIYTIILSLLLFSLSLISYQYHNSYSVICITGFLALLGILFMKNNK